MRNDFQIQFWPLDFTLQLPRFRGRYPSFSVVHSTRDPLHDPLLSCRRVAVGGGLEIRMGSKLIFAESHRERR